MQDVKRMYTWLKLNFTQREAECFLIGCNLALRAGDLLSLRFDQMEGETVAICEQKTGKNKEFPVTDVVRESVARLQEYYDKKNF
jgi:integrase